MLAAAEILFIAALRFCLFLNAVENLERAEDDTDAFDRLEILSRLFWGMLLNVVDCCDWATLLVPPD